MNEKAMPQQYTGNLSRLRKILNDWPVIASVTNSESGVLAVKILNHLYNGADSKKIAKVIAGELTVNYGLYTSAFDAEKIAAAIFNWWKTV